MAKVVWTSEAIVSLDLIREYIRQFDPEAAIRFAARLVEAGESLSTFPNRGRPGSRGSRELVTVRPYIIVYRVLDDGVRILLIRHSAQANDGD